jgi:kumamolisin
MLGGGFHAADLKAWFRRQRLSPAPRISVVRVSGEGNAPAPREAIRAFAATLGRTTAGPPAAAARRLSPASAANLLWSLETTMDIELVAALAPRAHIVVYFTRDTQHGKFDAISRILTDRRYTPSVISCSWSSREDLLSPASLRVLDSALRLAALRGITVCCSSGDHGADVDDGPHVHFPASSPYVLGCGGTRPGAGKNGERVWNEQVGSLLMSSGGGFSMVFPRPTWQASPLSGFQERGRGVPDVAAKADFAQGYGIIAGGMEMRMGGTSAATPLWASLIARINERLGARAGYVTPLLYGPCRAALSPVTRGSNGFFDAGPGWDACTGLGVPDGAALLDALR